MIQLTSCKASISFLADEYACNLSKLLANTGSTPRRVAMFLRTGEPRMSLRNTLLRVTSMMRESMRARPIKMPRVLYHVKRDLNVNILRSLAEYQDRKPHVSSLSIGEGYKPLAWNT